MARRSKVEACILCDQVPCVCGKKAPAAKKAPSARSQSPAERMRARASRSASPSSSVAGTTGPPVPIPAAVSAPGRLDTRAVDTEILIEEEAIRALRPLLSQEELKRHQMTLTSSLSSKEELAVWKWRRSHG